MPSAKRGQPDPKPIEAQRAALQAAGKCGRWKRGKRTTAAEWAKLSQVQREALLDGTASERGLCRAWEKGCRLHGRDSPKGIDHPNAKTLERSKYQLELPDELKRYLAIVKGNPDFDSLADVINMRRGLYLAKLEQYNVGDSERWRQRVFDAIKEAARHRKAQSRAQARGNVAAFEKATEDLDLALLELESCALEGSQLADLSRDMLADEASLTKMLAMENRRAKTAATSVRRERVLVAAHQISEVLVEALELAERIVGEAIDKVADGANPGRIRTAYAKKITGVREQSRQAILNMKSSAGTDYGAN